MHIMAKKKSDAHTQKQFQIRLHPLIRKQLDILIRRNVSTFSEEIRTALKKHLTDAGLWPPPQD